MQRYVLELKSSLFKAEHFLYSFGVNDFIAVTDDNLGIAYSLAEKFKNHGFRCEVVAEAPASTDVLILLEGLRNFVSIEEAMATNLIAFQQVKRVSNRFAKKGGTLITVQDTGGTFALNLKETNYNIWSAGLTGLVKTGALEWPRAYCKAIDLQKNNQSAEELANRLFTEIIYGDSTKECGLPEEEKRVTLSLSSKQIKEEKPILNPGDLLVATGGGRGITAACLIALAKKTRVSLVLLGRTPLEEIPCFETEEPKIFQYLLAQDKRNKNISDLKSLNKRVARIKSMQNINKTLKTLNDIGAKAEYFCVDVLDFDNLQETFKQIREKFGTIHGIIHGAGVLADKLIHEQTEEQFNYVFDTKVKGLKNLLLATKKDSLKLIVLFSSIAARFGNQGQCAYSMANEILNKVGQYERKHRKPDCIIKSFNWGPWEIGMVNPGLKKKFSEEGVHLISEKEGTTHFINELSASNENEVEIVFGGKDKKR